MEEILKKLFDIDYYLPWSDDTLLESTEAFKKLEKATMAFKPDPKGFLLMEVYNCVLSYIAAQVLRGDQHEGNSLSSIKNGLENGVEDLNLKDFCAVANYLGLYRNLKPDDTDDNYFLTADENERVNDVTVCSQIVISLISDVEIGQARLNGFLYYGLPKEFWYDIYEAENENSKEDVDSMVRRILT